MEKEQRDPVIWKKADEASIDPFDIPEETEKKEPLKLPPPTPKFAAGETNAIHKELIEEIEAACAAIHPHLAFYERDNFSQEDLAKYTSEEAQEILKTKSKLNPEQWGAALQSVDDLNIKALAGTGKTSLLSASISYLLAIGVDPERIAISSHTVTAAAEIEGRILPTLENLFPNTFESLGKSRMTAGTIHAIANRELIAHRHPKCRWTILDEGHQFRIWKEAMLFAFPDNAAAEVDNQAGEEMRMVDRVRGYDVAESRVPEILEMLGGSENLKTVAETYRKIKEARKLMDYTDLLREWAQIICHPGYFEKWRYFFVDEFQDTNPIQKFLLKLLKAQGAKLVVCGDNRQSINSFTGSDPTSHEAFFESCGIKEAWLETNYRCSKEVISLANAIIGSMSPPEKGRLKAFDGAPTGEATKMVMTKKASDTPKWLSPKEAEAQKKVEAGVSCAEAIMMFERLNKENPGERQTVAILYRTNAQGGVLEETMAVINSKRADKNLPPIPYSRKDYRRTALRNKTERDLLAVLATWADPNQCQWESLLLCPYFHGIGEVTARTIQRKADKGKPKTITETEEIFEGELTRRNAEIMGEFFDAWRLTCREGDDTPDARQAASAVEDWIAVGANKKSLEPGSKKETEHAQKRSYEAGILERVRTKANAGKSLQDCVAEIAGENEKNAMSQNNANRALGLVATEQKVEKEEGLVLSTIHLAKGREYDGVVVHQISRGSLPHFNALRFYENDRNRLEKGFRKYVSFPSLQDQGAHPQAGSLPTIWRTGIPESKPRNKIEEWEDFNNPLEEEKRLLYVAVTRAKKLLTITTADHDYQFLPKEIWKKLKESSPFLEDKSN